MRVKSQDDVFNNLDVVFRALVLVSLRLSVSKRRVDFFSVTFSEGVSLPTNHRQVVQENGTLILEGVSRAQDQGWYTCSVSNFDDQGMSRDLYVHVAGECAEFPSRNILSTHVWNDDVFNNILYAFDFKASHRKKTNSKSPDFRASRD